MNKTIQIKKTYIINLIISFLIGFSLLYGLEHNGRFTYNYDESTNSYHTEELTWESRVSLDARITNFTYHTFFGNQVVFLGNGFTIEDLSYSESKFNLYSAQSYYFTQATIKDYKYGLLFTLIIFILIIFFKNFKIKII